jgi:hypothetical protein
MLSFELSISARDQASMQARAELWTGAEVCRHRPKAEEITGVSKLFETVR